MIIASGEINPVEMEMSFGGVAKIGIPAKKISMADDVVHTMMYCTNGGHIDEYDYVSVTSKWSTYDHEYERWFHFIRC